ncbi:hypothetical protein Lfu02_77480 [Longispora fulva]|uniref:Uncharacterized protein n=1 Tax=Longispora fulva TaxID=619741 RepID=A0A8J7GEB8_9ACTN|nr:hypothetical protein [Longispora fulva]MBG6136136.1 hypothetical protein [Longispora fulva]GIG63376.1 hypothetical protein Lfu02_77480 [Longispora fulva]
MLTEPTTTVPHASAFGAIDTAWRLLTREPQAALSLDCDDLTLRLRLPAGSLPAGTRSMQYLRDWMLDNPAAALARDVIWRETASRAHSNEPGWVIAALGLAMPALVRCAGILSAGYRGDAADIDGELVAGFLTALRGDDLDLSRPVVYARLCWAGWRAARDLRLADEAEVPLPDFDSVADSRPPEVPWRHVDLLVQRACDLGLLSAQDIRSWIDIRLGGKTLALIAQSQGLEPNALRMRLARADRRIARALADGILTGYASHQAAAHLATAAASSTDAVDHGETVGEGIVALAA